MMEENTKIQKKTDESDTEASQMDNISTSDVQVSSDIEKAAQEFVDSDEQLNLQMAEEDHHLLLNKGFPYKD